MRATHRRAHSYRDLVAWQRAFALADACLELADHMPSRHAALAHQIRRSSVSVASNIAEGNGRLSLGDYIRHLRIAHGSLVELETQLLLARSRGQQGGAEVDAALARAAEVGRLLGGLLRSLERLHAARRPMRNGAGGLASPAPES